LAAHCAIVKSEYSTIAEVIMVVADKSACCVRVLAAFAAVFALMSGDARASEEAVDQATQTALSLDAHPDRGAAQFDHYCARCHGSHAEGDANRLIPELASQRFAYLVRQLVNFAGFERDSNTMHGDLLQMELRGPQSWVDIAAFLNRAP
jgi:cytochrome c553